MGINISSLTVKYGGVEALKNASLHVKNGEFVALIGANGAGKTTLLSAVTGIIRPFKGKIDLNGVNIIGKEPNELVKMGISLVPEGRRVFSGMTVKENLEVGYYTVSGGGLEEKLEEQYKLFPILKERSDQLAGMLSGGEQQMLAIGRALMSSPTVLLMDEPSMGLAPLVIKEVYEKLKSLQSQGLTIFLVEQNARSALKYADRGYVLETGTVVMSGTKEELLRDNELTRAYLGKEYKEKWER